MHPVDLIISFLLLLPTCLTAPNGIDALGCYDNTVVRSGFIGQVRTYRGGSGPKGMSLSEYSKICDGIFLSDYTTGGSLVGNVEPTTSINLIKMYEPTSIYGVPIKDKVYATLTGWWYAPMDGKYSFTLTAFDWARLDIESTSCCGTSVIGFYMRACTSPETAPHTFTQTKEFRGGVYYPIRIVYVRATGSMDLSAAVTLPDGSTVRDIGSMVHQVKQVKQLEQSCPVIPTSSSKVFTTTATSSSSSRSSSSKVHATTSSSSSKVPATTISSSSSISSSVSSSSSVASSLPYLSSAEVLSLTYLSSSSLIPSVSHTSTDDVPTSSNMSTLTAYSSHNLTEVTTATAENNSTTVLTFTSTHTYCPECESTPAETVSIPKTTKTEIKVITSTNDQGQTVTLATAITTTEQHEFDSPITGQATSVVPTSPALSSGSGNKDIHADSGNELEVDSGSVAAPALSSASGMDFYTVSKVALSSASGNIDATSSGYKFSSVQSSSVSTTAAVSTYDGSGSAMGMILSLAILPLLALLV